MELQQIDAKKLSEMFLAGAKYLENNKEHINELTQRIEKERELREEMFEQTQQLKLSHDRWAT